MTVLWNKVPKDERLRDLTLPEPLTPISREDAQHLAELVALKGLGQVAPNPLVGAVLVDRQHRFLAAGAHERVGQHHAEINALTAYDSAKNQVAGVDLRDGTLYVTLEPCAHQSRTPACAPRVAACGVGHVVYGAVDSNPAVNGRGAALLVAHHVAVQHDQHWQPRCTTLAEIFFWNMQKRTPFVGLKAATSLDGAIAVRGDQRAWITGPRARAYGHFLRLYYDAIMIGQRTLMADNPTLDTRDALTSGRSPWRIVLDPDGSALRSRAPKTWNLLGSSPEKVIWLLGKDAVAARETKALDDLGIQRRHLDFYPTGSAEFNPVQILAVLAGLGITSVLLEGGAGLYGSFLAAGLVNRVHLFQSARLFGGFETVHWTRSAGALTPAAASATEITPLDDDWLIETRLSP